jgi:phosphoglucomutase
MRFENNIIVASLPTLRVMSQIGAAADQASNLWTHDIADVGQISLGAANAGNAAAAALYGVNPGFVSPSTNPAAATQSFRLQSNSRARGAGIATSLSLTDIAGETLPKGKNINIGAYLQ